MQERARVVVEDGIAWITMDDAKVNAISVEMIAALAAALDAAEAARAVAVIRGRAGMFSAGFDLSTFKRGPVPTVEMLRAGARLYGRLLAFPYPVLTACAGHAYPAGAFLMLAADVRLAAAGPWRIGMNEVAIALTVPKFALALARHRLTPAGFARITTAAMFDPEAARHLGYVDTVLPADALDDAVRAEALRLRGLDMPSFAATKARVNAAAIRAIATAVEEELPAPIPC